MALLLLSIWIIAFIVFFYSIGLRYLWFLPILFLVIFLWYYGSIKSMQFSWLKSFQKYSLFIARIIILAWLVGMFNFFWFELIYICLGLITTNVILRIGSYLFEYEDGKSVFQLWFYLSVLFLLVVVATFGNGYDLFNAFTLMRVFHLGIISFIIFLVWLHKPIEKYMRYKFRILMIWMIILLIINQISNFYFALSLASVLLTWLYFFIYKIIQSKPPSRDKKINVSVRRILAGERITEHKYFSSSLTEKIYEFIATMPWRAKVILEFLNIFLIVALIIYYVMNISNFANMSHIFYRIIIVLFVINVLLLKKIWYNSIIQNLIVFLVINFAIYASLFSYFNADIWSIASRWIIRNVFSSLAIFYAPKMELFKKILFKIDYSYRLVSALIALIINIILLINTQLPGELIFFLVLLYIGLQGMILYYAVRYVSGLEIISRKDNLL